MTINQAGLWIDQDGWEERLETLPVSSSLKKHIRQFVEEGYTILPRAVEPELINAYLKQIQDLIAHKQKLKVSFVDGIYDISDKNVDTSRPLAKILDTYVPLVSARKIIFSKTLLNFIAAVFQEPPLAFQGLHFEVGSTQALHQDTAYVVVDQPDNFLASWVALEDIQPGSGELMYIPKSHKYPKFYFNLEEQRRHLKWPEESEMHLHYLDWLYQEADRHGLSVEKFTPRKGDVLLWHSNLAHGGSQITAPDATRKSLVTHYCPANNIPHYFKGLPEADRRKVAVDERSMVASYYYDTSAIPMEKKSLFERGTSKLKRILQKTGL